MNEFNTNALGHSNNDVDLTTVTNWLNNAATCQSVPEKIELLHKVQEFVIHKTPWLLPELISDILGFASDRNSDVKKCIVGFIEETCKQDEKLIPKVVVNLHLLLCDESVQVQKRVIQASSSVYKNMIIWLSKAQVISDEIEQAWDVLNHIKVEIVNMIDSDNDGVRTHSIKFLESVVLLQTYPELGAPRKEGDFSLEDIPLTLKIARRRKLEEEANHIFSLLVKFHGSPHISSVNLMACMGSLCTIAKLRSEFMSKVICALEHLQSNLPPTLSHSQVNSDY
ncbi:Symplekin [Carabus blaptoides fortunei]